VTEAAVLTLVGRPDCHLCHEMRQTLDRVALRRSIRIVEKNVDEDEALQRLYQLAIPVLLFGTKEIARHSISESSLEARLAGLGVL
jgi:glutaredoxin